MKHVNSFLVSQESKKEPAEKTPAEKSDKKILIKDFIVKDGQVALATSLLSGKSVSAPLPKIHLSNAGDEGQGASHGQVLGEIFKAL